jgi:hypothetical protein
VQEIPRWHEVVKHFAFLFERLTLEREVPELELRRCSDARLQF